jgi:hypothetical protein
MNSKGRASSSGASNVMDYTDGANRLGVADLVTSIVRAAHEDPSDPRRLLTIARSQIEELLAVPNLLTLGVPRMRVHSENSWWLYFDPLIRIAVATPESEPITHDHGTWQLFCVYNGEVDYRAYRRLDDGGVPGVAEIELESRELLQRGSILVIPPPPHDIHDWEPVKPETHLLAIHGPHMAPLRRYFTPGQRHYVVRSPR